MRDSERIARFAALHTIPPPILELAPPTPPLRPRPFSPEDRESAQALLLHARHEINGKKDPAKGLRGKLRRGSKIDKINTTFTVQERRDVFHSLLESRGSASVAQAVLDFHPSEQVNVNIRSEVPVKRAEPIVTYSRWLERATETSQREYVSLLASRKPKLNQNALDGALKIAMQNNFLEITKDLISYGANVNTCHREFQRRVADCDRTWATVFLNASVDTIDQVEKNKALQTAVENNDFEMAHLLLSCGADVNHAHGSCITTAVREARFRLLTLTIVRCSDIGHESLKGAIEWVIASINRNSPFVIDTIDILVSAGGRISKRLLPRVLLLVIERNNLEIISLLIRHRQIPSDVATSMMQRVMTRTSENEAFGICELLFKAGADANSLGDILHWAVQKDYDRVIDALVKHGVSLDWHDCAAVKVVLARQDVVLLRRVLGTDQSLSNTSVSADAVLATTLPDALAIASRDKRRQAVRLLVRKGVTGSHVDHSLLDMTASTALRDIEIVQTLLTAGASVNYYKDNENCVLRAARNVDVEMLQLLTAPTTNATPSVLTQALVQVYASRTKSVHFDVMAATELLLNRGADCNNSIVIPVFLAAVQDSNNKDSAAVVDLFLRYGANVNCVSGEVITTAFSLTQSETFKAVCGTGRIDEITFTSILPTILQSSRTDQARLYVLLRCCRAFEAAISGALIAETRDYQTGGQDEIVKALLENGANVNYNRGALLTVAIELQTPKKSLERLKLFLSKSPNHEALKTAFNSVRKSSCQRDHRYELFKSILQAGYRGKSLQKALEECVQSNSEDVALAELFLRHEAFQGPNTDSTLIAAITSGNIELADMFIERQLNASGFDKAFKALSLATLSNDKKVYLFKRLLITKKVSQDSLTYALSQMVNSDDTDRVVLALLASNGALLGDDTLLTLITRQDVATTVFLFQYVIPLQTTRSNAFQACLSLAKDIRYEFASTLVVDGLDNSVWLAATKRAITDHDLYLLDLLLKDTSTKLHELDETIVFAMNEMVPDIVKALANAKPSACALNKSFEIMTASGNNYNGEDLLAVALILLKHDISQSLKDRAFMQSLEAFGSPLYRLYEDLVKYGADVNTESCLAFCLAGQIEDLEAFYLMLNSRANFDQVICCLVSNFLQDKYDQLVELCYITFKSSHYYSQHPNVEIIFEAMRRFPHGKELIQLLLNFGYPAGDTLLVNDGNTLNTEAVTPVIWALGQPKPGVSDEVILELLSRDESVNPNFTTDASEITAISLAARSGRHKIMERLISLGANIAAVDSDGKSPLFHATAKADSIAIHLLLEERVPANDGSLHEAARLLELGAVAMLLEQDHDPDYSSDLHDGRTALGELCSQAILESGHDVAAANKTMRLLIEACADLTFRAKGKTVLHLALENRRPIEITRALLRFPEVYKDIRSDAETFLYQDSAGRYMSPDVYLHQCIDCEDQTKAELSRLLQSVSCKSKLFRKKGSQPEGYKGLPPELQKIMDQADLEDLAEQRAIQRRLESARVDEGIRQRQHQTSLAHTQQQADQQLRLENSLSTQRRTNAAADHAQARTALLERTRIENDASMERGRIENDAARERGQIEYHAAKNRGEIEYQSAKNKGEVEFRNASNLKQLEYSAMQNLKALEYSSQKEKDQQRYTARDREAGLERRMIDSREAADKRSHDRMMQRLSRQDQTIKLQAAEQRKLITAAKEARVSQAAIEWSHVDPD